ncbi:NAD-dependent protein deacetylases, SIR2 family [Longilinea arvoryzae]|uniref:protein acetyllysine N-acetyltransferase n=1 Tax=Longilinea arvoryzae TaxID=360412 RepID=A0A0S7BJ51_9CHLR|nr:NAD-dependent deacylase [Longilinea arvoryzae]GAP14376.1 NAD-dependent protein deacetylases, SIR2 family [Longilinea arvoryzae]
MTGIFDDLIQRAAEKLRSAQHAVALTGAGLSTPSGIPDFRSPGTGEWEHVDPLEVISLSTFRRRPERFFAWLRPLAVKMAAAEPNPAHLALAELEKAGILHAILTQNIDGLHQKAGSRTVIELHGSLKTLTCPACHRTFHSEAYCPAFIENDVLPHCTACNAILKPDIVFYEEMLPVEAWSRAVDLAKGADVFLVAGTSLEVLPVNSLPMLALKNGAELILNTLSPTYLDRQASILLKADVSLALPAITRAILMEN